MLAIAQNPELSALLQRSADRRFAIPPKTLRRRVKYLEHQTLVLEDEAGWVEDQGDYLLSERGSYLGARDRSANVGHLK